MILQHRMKNAWMTWRVTAVLAVIAGCGSPAADVAVEPATPAAGPGEALPKHSSQAALVDSVTGAAYQASTAASLVQAWLTVDEAARATSQAIEMQDATTAALTDVQSNVGSTVEAIDALRGTALETMLPLAASAVSQLLSLNPSRSDGPIARTFGGTRAIPCGRITGFASSREIREPNPPQLRLDVEYDSSAGPACRADGAIRFELRSDATGGVLTAIRLVMRFPQVLTLSRPDGVRTISANSAIEVRLLFNGFPHFSGVELVADYCESEAGREVCLRDVTLNVQGGISFSYEAPSCEDCNGGPLGLGILERIRAHLLQVSLEQASLSLTAKGTVSALGSSLSWGSRNVPLSVALSVDRDQLALVLNGRATRFKDGVAHQIAFEGPERDVQAGFRVELPHGEHAMNISGCFSNSVDNATQKTCVNEMAFAAEPLEGGGLRLLADGTIVRSAQAERSTTVVEGIRLEIDQVGGRLDGRVVRTEGDERAELRFAGLAVAPTELSGSFGVYRNGERHYGVDVCPGTGLRRDAQAETMTLSGCVLLVHPEQTVAVGTPSAPVALVYSPTSVGLDGAVTVEQANQRSTLSMQNGRAEFLESPGHFRLMGSGSVVHGADAVRVAITEPLEVRVSGEGSAAIFAIDGRIAVEFAVNDIEVAGQVGFDGTQLTTRSDGLDIVGRVALAFDPERSGLPTDDVRIELGDTGEHFAITNTQHETILDGRAMIGLACSNRGCASVVEASLTQLAFARPLCGHSTPHAGRVALSGLSAPLALAFAALQVACDCNGQGGVDRLLAESLTMVFDSGTPTDGIVEVPEATGVCLAQSSGNACTSAGTAQLRWTRNARHPSGMTTDGMGGLFPACQ